MRLSGVALWAAWLLLIATEAGAIPIKNPPPAPIGGYEWGIRCGYGWGNGSFGHLDFGDAQPLAAYDNGWWPSDNGETHYYGYFDPLSGLFVDVEDYVDYDDPSYDYMDEYYSNPVFGTPVGWKGYDYWGLDDWSGNPPGIVSISWGSGQISVPIEELYWSGNAYNGWQQPETVDGFNIYRRYVTGGSFIHIGEQPDVSDLTPYGTLRALTSYGYGQNIPIEQPYSDIQSNDFNHAGKHHDVGGDGRHWTDYGTLKFDYNHNFGGIGQTQTNDNNPAGTHYDLGKWAFSGGLQWGETPYGTLDSYLGPAGGWRSYSVYAGQLDGSVPASNAPIDAGGGSATNRAFIQWAGMTAGIAESFYDYYSVPASSYLNSFATPLSVPAQVTIDANSGDSSTGGKPGNGGGGEPTVTAKPGLLVKLFTYKPPLPVSGKPKPNDIGFDQDPVQCRIDQSGRCTVTVTERWRYGIPATGKSFAMVLAAPYTTSIILPVKDVTPTADWVRQQMPRLPVDTGVKVVPFAIGEKKYVQAMLTSTIFNPSPDRWRTYLQPSKTTTKRDKGGGDDTGVYGNDCFSKLPAANPDSVTFSSVPLDRALPGATVQLAGLGSAK